MLILLVTCVIVVPIAFGVARSWRLRQLDRRHFAGFLGFVAALTGLVAEVGGFLTSPAGGAPSGNSALQVAGFCLSVAVMVCMIAALVCGIMSRGIQRVGLILTVLVMVFIWLLIAAGNFGN